MDGSRAFDEAGSPVGIAVASAGEARSAVLAALAVLGEPPAQPDEAIVLLPPPPTPGWLREGVRAIAGSAFAGARPRGGIAGLAAGADEWRAISLSAGARRFDRVGVPGRLLDRPLVLAAPLPTGASEPTPIELLAAFAHPRQRIAARFGGDPGTAAELAAPLRPRLVLLAGEAGGRCVAVLTRDLIAAELVARALIPAKPDAPGPWEHPVVQRATELDLGVRTPAGIRLLAADDDAATFAAAIRPRIGIS